jgi:hypothetical protein
MSGKQMEGGNAERRRRARQARAEGTTPAEAKVTLGASKQRQTLRQPERQAGDADAGKQRADEPT